jgi:OFA family oxalate/formate antiporter-like MFS transporter
MFTAYGAGGIAGPYLAASLMRVVGQAAYEAKDAAGTITQKLFTIGDYQTAFIVAGIACVVAAALVTQIRTTARK